MFSSLLNKASDAPEYGYGYQEKEPFQWKWYHAVLILVAIFPYVCIFALFGMVSNVKHETTNNVSLKLRYFIDYYIPNRITIR